MPAIALDSHNDKKRIVAAIVACAIVVASALGYLFLTRHARPAHEAGTTVAETDGMSDADIRAELDRQVEASRMTISVAPTPRLQDGKVRVNVVNDPSNKFDQSFTLTQGGKTIYSSGVVRPGETVEWVEAPDARAGDATLTIQALDPSSDEASGNPQSVSVQITPAGSQG